jgi:hypothetical protein
MKIIVSFVNQFFFYLFFWCVGSHEVQAAHEGRGAEEEMAPGHREVGRGAQPRGDGEGQEGSPVLQVRGSESTHIVHLKVYLKPYCMQVSF